MRNVLLRTLWRCDAVPFLVQIFDDGFILPPKPQIDRNRIPPAKKSFTLPVTCFFTLPAAPSWPSRTAGSKLKLKRCLEPCPALEFNSYLKWSPLKDMFQGCYEVKLAPSCDAWDSFFCFLLCLESKIKSTVKTSCCKSAVVPVLLLPDRK